MAAACFHCADSVGLAGRHELHDVLLNLLRRAQDNAEPVWSDRSVETNWSRQIVQHAEVFEAE